MISKEIKFLIRETLDLNNGNLIEKVRKLNKKKRDDELKYKLELVKELWNIK